MLRTLLVLTTGPCVEEPILGGEGEISGGFSTLVEAQGVADQMNVAARAAEHPAGRG